MATDPGTRSPGHMFLKYSTDTTQHTTSVRLVNGVDLDDITTLRADANLWATWLARCMPGVWNITDWGLRSNEGTVLYAEAFSSPYAGSKGTVIPMYRSTTVYIEGHGNSTGAGSAFGHMGFRFFCGGCFDFTPGLQRIVIASDTDLSALKTHLDGSTRIFADFYGQKGDVNSLAPVQFNAHAQRALGC